MLPYDDGLDNVHLICLKAFSSKGQKSSGEWHKKLYLLYP